ncbi:MAG TPA: sigma 54-interacting transcriptional regulator [Gemmatimonadaceae bacterium]|nr:sigma 54-interacting transcriptional regulator [Gemmatimonadaceae bacterium]
MIEAISRAHAFAPAATPVIIHGESGTGKTFFAEYIHRLSQRLGSLIAFSVGMLTPQLAVDELFGHVQGAYTDARRMRTGLIATAGVGTLLLDDFQNLDLGVQKQLLQVLDRGTYSPVGSDRVLAVACRIILAMTEEPDALMTKGLLLKDLRYRFGACAIRIPPLRERRAEIPVLAERALRRCPQQTGVEGPTRFSDTALNLLSAGEYPGNVRQLEGVVLRAYLLAKHQCAAKLDVAHFPSEVIPSFRYKRRGDREENRVAMERALGMTGGNVTKAARLLGVSRNAFNAARANQVARYREKAR